MSHLSPWARASLSLVPMLGFAAPAAAAAPDCGLGVPKVTVERSAPPIAFDFGQSSAELADRFAKRYPDKPRPGGVLGETILAPQWSAIPIWRIEPHGPLFCAVPSELRIKIDYRRRTILVAREIADDGCLRDEVMAHEHRHVGANDAAVAAATATVERDFRAFAAAQRVPAGATAADASTHAQQALSAWLATWRAAIGADAARQDAAIDSPEEAKRMRTMCDGRANPVLAALRGPLAPPPPPAPPTFGGTIAPIGEPIVLALRPFAETGLTVAIERGRLHGGAQAMTRRVIAARTKAERSGDDIVVTDHLIGLDGTVVRLVASAAGQIRALTVETPKHAADPAARQLAATVTDAYARRAVPSYPDRGIRAGDDIAAKFAERPLITVTHTATVRGRSTFHGRPVVVVDTGSTSSGPTASGSMRGYGLIDLETGFWLHSDENAVEVVLQDDDAVRFEVRTQRTVAHK